MKPYTHLLGLILLLAAALPTFAETPEAGATPASEVPPATAATPDPNKPIVVSGKVVVKDL